MNDQMAILMSDSDVESFDPIPAVGLRNEAKMRRRRLESEVEQPDEDMVSGLEEGHNRLQELVDRLSEVVVIVGIVQASSSGQGRVRGNGGGGG